MFGATDGTRVKNVRELITANLLLTCFQLASVKMKICENPWLGFSDSVFLGYAMTDGAVNDNLQRLDFLDHVLSHGWNTDGTRIRNYEFRIMGLTADGWLVVLGSHP